MSRSSRSRLAVVALLAVVLLAGCERRDLPTVQRPHDAVVLAGADVAPLIGVAPERIVAFRFVYGTWQQIPIQVDERAVVDFATIKHLAPIGVSTLQYTDASTWTGADPDPALDADDEIAFMARDAWGEARSIDDDRFGIHYSLGEPTHVVAGSGVEIEINDPLVNDSASWVYLFESDGTLDPAAGRKYLEYNFVLDSGDYRSTYQIGAGPNPETSSVVTPDYSNDFADRWITNRMQITRGAASGIDVLDRHKAGFAGTCGRTELTFSTGSGAFVANKSGPVRAIRSYIGANSGPYTQRDHIMYSSRHEVVTHLRVHAIPPLRDWFDYSPAASGMRYSNNVVPGGVTIDGIPDTVPTTPATWEMVQGDAGALVTVPRLEASFSLSLQHYYSDTLTPTETQCTGDAFEYGASGTLVDQSVPCTDPTQGCTDWLRTTRTITFVDPDTRAAEADRLASEDATPLVATPREFTP